MDGFVIHGAVETAEVFDEPVTRTCPKCGKPITVTAGTIQKGDTLKFAGSTETCECGATVQLNAEGVR
jgi:hypothetical protein